MPVPNDMYDAGVEAEEPEGGEFLEKMLRRVNRDFEAARKFRDLRRRKVDEYRRQYRNARWYDRNDPNWVNLKELPLPIAQQLIDQLRATLQDKMQFNNRPCRTVGTPGTPQDQVDVIQEVVDWQDFVDDIPLKLGEALNSAAVDGPAIAQVDFLDKKKKDWQQVEVPDPDQLNAITGFAVARGLMEMPTRMEWQYVEVTEYMGPTVKNLDANNLYFARDKWELGDPFPLMVKSRQAKEFFSDTSKPYFFNQDKIQDSAGSNAWTSDVDNVPDATETMVSSDDRTDRMHQYIEWQGQVNKAELYAYTGEGKSPDGEAPDIDPEETTWAYCGVVNGKVVVRLHEEPFGLNGPNIVVGGLMTEGSVFRTVAIMDLIFALCREADQVAGMMRENIVQNIDSMWAVDGERIRGKHPIVNSRGAIIDTMGNPNEVIMQIQQLPQAEALGALIDFYFTKAKEAARIPDIALGKGDPNAETLGESTLSEGHATIGISEYLRVFETTFLRPLYQMRMTISTNLIDEPFVFGVVGDGAMNWKGPLKPEELRPSVDFICESSTRESNRAVMTSQMMAFLDVAPQLIAVGVPVDVNQVAKFLAQNGFTMSEEQTEAILPLLKLEKEDTDLNVGELLAQTSADQMEARAIDAATQLAAMKLGVLPGGGGEGGTPATGGEQQAQPFTEAEAQQNVNKENQVTLR